jgi:hypothetical protein
LKIVAPCRPPGDNRPVGVGSPTFQRASARVGRLSARKTAALPEQADGDPRKIEPAPCTRGRCQEADALCPSVSAAQQSVDLFRW